MILSTKPSIVFKGSPNNVGTLLTPAYSMRSTFNHGKRVGEKVLLTNYSQPCIVWGKLPLESSDPLKDIKPTFIRLPSYQIKCLIATDFDNFTFSGVGILLFQQGASI